MRPSRERQSRGFSLLEMVIVIVIIAIVAAIAVPRLSRGTSGAADAALTADLAVLRNQLDMYYSEHGNTWPTVADIADQLTQYTDAGGTTSATKTTSAIYGPYLRSVPPLPVGAKKDCTGIAANDGAGVGWIYTAATGEIKANCTASEIDDTGKKYSDY